MQTFCFLFLFFFFFSTTFWCLLFRFQFCEMTRVEYKPYVLLINFIFFCKLKRDYCVWWDCGLFARLEFLFLLFFFFFRIYALVWTDQKIGKRFHAWWGIVTTCRKRHARHTSSLATFPVLTFVRYSFIEPLLMNPM